MTRVGLNGFGRTGRSVARILLDHPEIELTAINSRAGAASHAYLLKYDSIYGTLSADIRTEDDTILIDDRRISVFQAPTPDQVPWGQAGVEIVIDCTGKFKTRDDASGHLDAGADRVIISAPSPDASVPTVVMGVNHQSLTPDDRIVSNASCTTNCLAVTCAVLHKHFTIKRGTMTTIHSPTDSQNLLDNSNKKTRLRRAAPLSIIPSSTGASQALGRVLPELKGRLDCISLRVPPYSGSLIDLVVETAADTTVEGIHEQFFQAANGELQDYLAVATDELVSVDIRKNPHSAVIDPDLTSVTGKNLVKVFAWYDNEWGYSTRLVDLAGYLAELR